MKKMLVLLLITALVMGVVALAGCGEKKVTIEGEDGEVDITEKDGDVSVTDEGGDTTKITTDVSEDDLGVPFYPGAEVTMGSVVSSSGEGGASLSTKDSIAEVSAWYKDKLSGEPSFVDTSMDIEGEEVGWFSFQSGDSVATVMIVQDETSGQTSINIAIAPGEIPELP